MRAASPYNVLHLISNHGDPIVREVAVGMRDKAMEGIEIMIKSWCSKGQVDDPFSEFFVRCKDSVVLYSNWWHDCYFIAAAIVPSNLTQSMMDLIMSAGKALNFIRKFDRPIELDIDKSLPLPDFLRLATAESNRHLLDLILKDGLFATAVADIHNLMLSQRGDFLTALFESEKQAIRPSLQFVVREFTGRTIPALTFRDGCFVYDAKPPLSAVFGPYELQAYKSVSSILLRVRRSLQVLLSIEKSTIQMQIMVFESVNFVNLIHQFFHTQVIMKSYSTFNEVLSRPDITFDLLLSEHTKHTSNIARGCWMSKSGMECRDSLYEILAILESLANPKETLGEIKAKFHASLFKFHTMLLNHPVSGRSLVSALRKSFRHVFR
jgi:hypothetical protein